MNVKKILLIICVSITTVVQAQDIRMGIKGGIGESTFPLKLTQNNQSATLTLQKFGFQLGFIGDYGVNEEFSIQPQLLIATRGGDLNASMGQLSFKIIQAELPIHLLYHREGFFMGGGPYVSYGFTAKARIVNNPEVDMYKDTAVGLGNIKFKRFEAGVSARLGYEFPSGFLISAYYAKGLSNISTSSIAEIQNKVYGISIGYFFRPRKGAIAKK